LGSSARVIFACSFGRREFVSGAPKCTTILRS
jgi:hypothetical protein